MYGIARCVFATEPAAMGAVLGFVCRAIAAHLVRKARLPPGPASTIPATTLARHASCFAGNARFIIPIREMYLVEKADRALIRQYRYMYSLFPFAAAELKSAGSFARRADILHSLGHARLAEHVQWILKHRDKRIEGLRW